MNAKTHSEDGVILGGALIPGWTRADVAEGDENIGSARRVEIFNW
jgi:hypothetical protein